MRSKRWLTHIESAPLPATLELRQTRSRKGAAAMKNQAIQYLAFDVHQATVVATVRDEHGAIRLRATVLTGADGGECDPRSGAQSGFARAYRVRGGHAGAVAARSTAPARRARG